jgi:hypothetical protein
MTELETLRARVAELEAGLKPMSDAWAKLQSDGGINDPERPSHGTGIIKQKHLRRAASLLSDTPEAERTPEQRAALDELLREDGELYDDDEPVPGGDPRLKPCPFCGCLGWIYSDPSAFAGHTEGGSLGHRVECAGSCHGMTCWWHTKEEAIQHWNMRSAPTTPDPEPSVVERVARAIWKRQGYCKDDLDDPFQRLSWEELNEIEADYAPTVAHTMDLARAAIAAMRPPNGGNNAE